MTARRRILCVSIVAALCALAPGRARAAPVALVNLVQGSTAPGAGVPILNGVVGTAVSITNGSNTGVLSWQIGTVYVPFGSARSVATLAFSDNGTIPAASFTPDVAGCYRVLLQVWSVIGRPGTANDAAYLNFCVHEIGTDYLTPPFQQSQIAGKPNELGTNGFAGDGTAAGGGLNYQTRANAASAIVVDGISIGTLRLGVVPVAGLPSYRTRAWVTSVGDWFVLQPSTGLADKPLVLVSAPDGRQWQRQGVSNQAYLAAAFWSVDPASGSDEHQCWGTSEAAADAVACKTLAELNRRLTGSNVTTTVEIHVLGDIPLSDNGGLPNAHSSGGTGFPNMIGKRTQVGGDFTISAYATAVPASNTGYLVTATGLGSTDVGLLMQNAAGNKSAIVQSTPTTNKLRISAPNSSSVVDASLGAISDFTVGETVRFFQLPRIPAVPFTGTGGVFGMGWMRIGYGFDAQQDTSNLGASTLYATQCTTEGGAFYGGINCSYTTVGFAPGPTIGEPTFLEANTAFAAWVAVRGTGLQLLKNSKLEPSYLDIEAGQIVVEASRMDFGGGFPVSAFDCTTPAIIVDAGGQIEMAGTSGSPLYGGGNSGAILSFEQRTSGILYPAAGLTATTSAGAPILIDGTGVAYAGLPYTDLSTGTTVSLWH